MKLKAFFLILSLILSLSSCQSKTNKGESKQSKIENARIDSLDLNIFHSLTEMAKNSSFDSMTSQDQIIEIGKLFLQTPYVGGTLDVKDKEELIINLHQLDCTTYLENVLAFSNVLKQSKADISSFSKELEKIRYRNGNLTDYSSRLHYFTDWIFNNEEKGLVTDITQEIGGEPYEKKIDFMSTHINSYPALVKDSSLIETIKQTEKEINSRKHFYIPKNRIQSIEKQINNGDFIAITTKIKGLDVSHTGIAIHINKRLHLMHASSKSKKVVISEIPLAEKIQKNRLQSGIMIVRITSKQ